MKTFRTPEYFGVWLPYLEERMEFRKSVETYLKTALHDPAGKLEVKEDGPHWMGEKKIELSYSHTPGAAILVYSFTHQLGVDVESESRDFKSDPLKIAARFYHPDETKALEKLPKNERFSALLKLWVKKEAYAKFTRLGLSKTVANLLPASLNAKTLPVMPEGFLSAILFEKI
jgi:phosphopantetheinyl transferase